MNIQWIRISSFWKAILVGISILLFVWLVLSLFVKQLGDEQVKVVGNNSSTYKAMIVYNPDPFYDLDEQVSTSFANGLAERNWQTHILTVARADKENLDEYDLLIFCANTYNWAPDAVLTAYIEHKNFQNTPSIAITLGANTTNRAQHLLEEQIKKQGGTLIDSRAYWLLKPNRENYAVVSNVKMAKMLAFNFGVEIANLLETKEREN